MKILAFFLISLVIITVHRWQMPICQLFTAKQALPPRIFAEQTVDGPQPVIITRFLHNKPGIIASEISKCYFNVLDPNFIREATSLLGLFFFLYFTYRIFSKKNWSAIVVFLLAPIMPFFDLPVVAVVIIYKIFAIIGLSFFLRQP